MFTKETMEETTLYAVEYYTALNMIDNKEESELCIGEKVK